MQQRQLGKDGPSVGAIAMGGMLLSIAGRPPLDHAQATIRTALNCGLNLFDTADAYCLDATDLHHNEILFRDTLREHRHEVLIATKCGMQRPGGAWTIDARPSVLREGVHASLKALDTDCIDLLQLQAPDTRVPFEESVGALSELKREGKVKYLGLCNVTVDHLRKATSIVTIQSVQNRLNLEDRSALHDGVLDYCARNGLAFLAYSPFGGTRGAPVVPTFTRLAELAKRRRVTAYRLVLAWLLAKSGCTIPVVGSRRPESIRDSARCTQLMLEPRDVEVIDQCLAPDTQPEPRPL